MKRLFLFFLVFANLLGGYAVAYDFSQQCESGQTLYYKITSSTEPYTVGLTFERNGNSSNNFTYYSAYLTGNLTIPLSVTYNDRTYSVTSIGGGAFLNCSGLTSVSIPSSVTSIDNRAFAGCSGLTSVKIPNSVTSIGDKAFAGCNGLTDMTIPFVGSSATATTASPSTLFGYIFGTESYTGGSAVTQYYYYSYSSSSNVTYYIPSSLRSVTVTGGNLNYGAFYRCSMLTSIIVTNSVTSISEDAFYECRGLTSVTIGDSVTSIASGVFSGCSSLIEMTIPFLGRNISTPSIFSFLFGRTSYTGGTPINQTGGAYDTYYIPSSLRSVTITGGTLADQAFRDCTMITSVTIGNGVTSIGNYVFLSCTGLTSVIIGNSVTSIGNCAFSQCSGLTSVSIPNSVTSISNGTFVNCSSLTSITIPNSVTSIGNHVFYDCSGLTTIVIGNSVTDIGDKAFYNCSSLTDIYVNSITPPNASGCFNSYVAIVWVPCGTKTAYMAANGWRSFRNINERRTYTLDVSSANTQMGTASVTQQPDCEDGTAIILATPNRGYAFSQWNDGNSDNPRAITVTTDVEYTASFVALSSYTITVVSDDETRGTVTGGGAYYDGETATLTASANDGYAFDSWADGSTDNPRTVTITGNATYTATFKAWRTISVISADETQGIVSGGGTYLEDEEIEISATPSDHYHFVHWTDGNIDNPRAITVIEDTTYTAIFSIDQHTVTVVSANENMGIVSEGGIYDYGTEIQISATPAEGHGFVSWNDGNTDNPRAITVTGDITYTANFGALRTIIVTSVNETMGAVLGSGEYVEGTAIRITAVPNEHYHFVHWIDEENPTRDFNTNNPRTIIVTRNMTYTAVFSIDQHTVNVVSANENMGVVSEGGTYDYGTDIQISATPAGGHDFVSWNDGNTNNPRAITVTGDITYTAYFGALRTIIVTSANETQGTVEGTGEYVEGTTIQITAIPNEHYHFVHWVDVENPTRSLNTDNPRTITVTGNMTYWAVFEIDKHNVSVVSANENMGIVSDGGTYDYGTEIQISATANSGYRFLQWNDGNTDNPRTITVTGDLTYTASFTSLTGINETAIPEIGIFPNPTTDLLNITSSETISEIEIVNVMGQVVRRIDVNSDNVVCNVEDLTSGVYVVRIRTLRCAESDEASKVERATVLTQRKFVKE